MDDLNALLRATVRLEIGKWIATGFIICPKDASPVLVTVAHFVVEPHDEVRVLGRGRQPAADQGAKSITISVRDPQWMIHPDYRYRGAAVQDKGPDVACLALSAYPEVMAQLDVVALSPTAFPSVDDERSFGAVEEVFMCGCPGAMWDQHNGSALVQRGITSSDPRQGHDDLPIGILDIFCLAGSSGSPVAILREESYAPMGERYGIRPLTITRRRLLLLGVQVGIPSTLINLVTDGNDKYPIYAPGVHLAYYVRAEEILRLASEGVPAAEVYELYQLNDADLREPVTHEVHE